ncbi:signal recognition particle-docking protein FtsY, partial [Mycobacterium arosiense ATCC BAA-1401 = DSM 45069]
MSQGLWIAVAVVAALLVITALVLGLLRYRRRRISFAARTEPGAIDRSGGYTASSGITFSQTTTADRLDTTGLPAVGDDAAVPRDAPRRTISEVELPEPEPEPEAPAPPPPSVQAPSAPAARA